MCGKVCFVIIDYHHYISIIGFHFHVKGARDRPGGGHGGGPGLGFGNNTVELKIPNNMVGLLIGKSGETIRNIQQSSGAHVQGSVLLSLYGTLKLVLCPIDF